MVEKGACRGVRHRRPQHGAFTGFILLSAVTALFTPTSTPAVEEKPAAVAIQKADGRLEIAIDGKPFFTYQYDTQKPEVRRPLFHPLYGPTGAVITQMGEVPGKRTAHYWHTGLWISHQKFTEGNNWQLDADPSAKPRKYSSLLHRGFDQIASGAVGRFVERLEWDNIQGDKILLEEIRTVTIPHRPAERRVIDFDLLLKARAQPITLMATPYQIFSIRAVNTMVPAFNKEAFITNSAGQKNPKDGATAEWIDVTGPLDGKTVGVTLMNHPGNFRHPTPCMNFANQTIGLAPTHQQGHTLQPHDTLRLRCRVLVHAGTPDEAKVADEYELYGKGAK